MNVFNLFIIILLYSLSFALGALGKYISKYLYITIIYYYNYYIC